MRTMNGESNTGFLSMINYWYVGLTVILVVFLAFVYKYYKLGKESEDSKKETDSLDTATKTAAWLKEKINEYSKKALAYQLNRQCLKQDVPSEVADRLREKFGNEVVCPMFNIAGEFLGKFHADLSFLKKAFKVWCEENHVECEDDSAYEQVIAQNLLNKAEEEAKKIIEKEINH